MQRLKNIIIASVCVLSLGACETMSDTWDSVTGTAPSADDVPPATQAAVTPTGVAVPCPCAQNAAIPAPPATAPNLAEVPDRPTAAQLPDPANVEATRKSLAADNMLANGTFMSPAMPSAQPGMTTGDKNILRDPHAPAAPAVATSTTTTQTEIGGKLLGLQATSTGQYQLVPVLPEQTIGTFNLATSVVQSSGAPLSMGQYQNLQAAAASYKQKPGRVRVVGYGASGPALAQATTIAAYLVDMGVAPASIRLKVDPAAGLSSTDPTAQKIDIFLEMK